MNSITIDSLYKDTSFEPLLDIYADYCTQIDLFKENDLPISMLAFINWSDDPDKDRLELFPNFDEYISVVSSSNQTSVAEFFEFLHDFWLTLSETIHQTYISDSELIYDIVDIHSETEYTDLDSSIKNGLQTKYRNIRNLDETSSSEYAFDAIYHHSTEEYPSLFSKYYLVKAVLTDQHRNSIDWEDSEPSVGDVIKFELPASRSTNERELQAVCEITGRKSMKNEINANITHTEYEISLLQYDKSLKSVQPIWELLTDQRLTPVYSEYISFVSNKEKLTGEVE